MVGFELVSSGFELVSSGRGGGRAVVAMGSLFVALYHRVIPGLFPLFCVYFGFKPGF